MFGMLPMLPPPPPPLERTEKAMAAYLRECESVAAFNRRQLCHQAIGVLAFGVAYVVGVPLAIVLFALFYTR